MTLITINMDGNEIHSEYLLSSRNCWLPADSQVALKLSPAYNSVAFKAVDGLCFIQKTQERTTTKGKLYKCKLCEKCFTGRSHLNYHLRTHTGEKPFKCTRCEKCFTSNGYLKIHERIHTVGKSFKCTWCEKCFLSRSQLKNHERIHGGEKPYQCSVCNKCFTRNGNLKRHEETHTREKHFNCTWCQKRFTSNAYLKIHERKHTGENQSNPSPGTTSSTTRMNTTNTKGDSKIHEDLHSLKKVNLEEELE